MKWREIKQNKSTVTEKSNQTTMQSLHTTQVAIQLRQLVPAVAHAQWSLWSNESFSVGMSVDRFSDIEDHYSRHATNQEYAEDK